jgi:serine/threonine-protein kinase
VACVLALVAVVLGAFLVVGMPWSAGAGTTTAGGPPPASAPVPASPALPADPAQALEAQRGADAGAAEALVGSWAPQLSAKKQGLVVDGQTYDAATILADHQRLRGQQPDAILVWSGDFTSFRSSDFWITLANRPFSSAQEANAWCGSAGFGPDDCYAKRLSHTGGYAENTAMRTGAGTTGGGTSGGSPVAGATPVLGDAGWVPGGAGWGTVRPSEINANGDGTSFAEDVTWQSWGGAQATGRGTAHWVPPNGYQSDAVPRPAVVVATNLGDCHGRLAYRSVGWYFPTEGETSLPPGNGYEDICDGP